MCETIGKKKNIKSRMITLFVYILSTALGKEKEKIYLPHLSHSIPPAAKTRDPECFIPKKNIDDYSVP